jgi:PAS domain S-box-containing protein
MAFDHLKGYARFLLENHLDDLTHCNIGRAREVQLPLLKLFAGFSEAQLFDYSRRSLAELLTGLSQGTALQDQASGLQRWKSGGVPGVPASQINARDLAFAPHTRRYSLIKLLRRYTTDLNTYEAVVQEIELFYTTSLGTSLDAYVEVQQDSLRQEKDLLKLVVDNTRDGISIYDHEYRVTLWNRSVEGRTGILAGQIIGKKFFEVFPSYNETPDGRAMQRALQGEKVPLSDMPYKDREGYYESDLIPLRDEKGEVTGVLAVSRDITERKKALEKISRSESLMARAQEIAHFGSWEWNVDADEMSWSDEMYRIYGYAPQSVKLTSEWVFSHYHPDDLGYTMQLVRQVKEQPQPFESVHRIIRRDGSVRSIKLIGVVETNAAGQAIKLYGASQDITEQKRSQQALYNKNQELSRTLEELHTTQDALISLNNELEQKVQGRTRELAASEEELLRTLEGAIALNNRLSSRENFLASIIDQTPVSTWIADAEGTQIQVNRACLDLFGVEDESQGVGRYNILQDNTLQDRPYYGDILAVFREGKVARFEMDYDVSKVTHVDIPTGKAISLVVTIFPVKDADGRVVNAVVQHEDITARKKAEQALLNQSQLMQILTDNATSALLMIDAEGYCTFMNPAGKKMLGFTFEEIRQKPLHYVIHHHRPDGTLYPMEECPLGRALPENSLILAHEEVFIRKDGTFFPVFCAASPIFEKGMPVATVIEVRDITSEKEAQARLVQVNDELSGKNAELQRINADLDNFIYTASHDLRAPIANLESILTMLRKRLKDRLDATEAPLMEFAGTAIGRLKQTIKDLTEISKVQREAEDPAEEVLFAEMLEDVQLDISDQITDAGALIRTDFAVPAIHYARKNIRSVLYNLLSNAIKYRSPDRRPEVTLSTRREQDKVLLRVEDNGLGIAPNQLPKVFTMFKRFHSHIEGTGIGLYIVKRIVENSGGSITVTSEEGKGTVFLVYLREK